jgi:hypothetical protein
VLEALQGETEQEIRECLWRKVRSEVRHEFDAVRHEFDIGSTRNLMPGPGRDPDEGFGIDPTSQRVGSEIRMTGPEAIA